MAQEVNTLQTNNSAGGFFGTLFSGLASLVTAAAPAAASVYQLQTQADVLKNQSANQLAATQLQQAQLAAAAAAKPATTTTATTLPTWFPYAAIAVVVLVLVAVVMRVRSR